MVSDKTKLLLSRAYFYMLQLADGKSPIDGSELGEESIVKDLKVHNCLQYVAKLLGEVVRKSFNAEDEEELFDPALTGDENYYKGKSAGKKNRKIRPPFVYDAGKAAEIRISPTPCSLSTLVKEINAVFNEGKKVKYSELAEILVEQGILINNPYSSGGRYAAAPDADIKGIFTERKVTSYGREYFVTSYTQMGQKLVLEFLPLVAERQREKALKNDSEEVLNDDEGEKEGSE